MRTRTRNPRSWTAHHLARRAPAPAEPQAPALTFNELRKAAVAAGVSAAETRLEIEQRLAALEEA